MAYLRENFEVVQGTSTESGEIIRQAQARMRAAGSSQWQDGYPAPGHISADIGRNRGYVLCKPGVEGPLSVIAYGAVVFDGEPAYDAIDGQWLTDEPITMFLWRISSRR